MIKVKICGITNEKEIEYVNILKPEYIGFVFTKSKRKVSAVRSRELSRGLNNEIKIVGVFKDNSIEEILEIIKEIKLDIIQLHGKETYEFIEVLKRNIADGIGVWKALNINDIKNYISTDYFKTRELIDNFLIDGDNPGSGETYSLENIKEHFKLMDSDNLEVSKNKFFLAGGITPENVLERISIASPIGVDVSSGVESIDENGTRTKSFEKMKKLIGSIREIQSKS